MNYGRMLLALLLFAVNAAADDPGRERLIIVTSPDGSGLLRITPSSYTSGGPAHAIVMRFDKNQRTYLKIADFPLRNRWSPGDAVITNEAQFVVTFDDLGEIGRTNNTIVVYRGTGEVIRAFSLLELFTEAETKTFAMSASSTWWRDEVRVSEGDGQNPVIAIFPNRRIVGGSPLFKGRNHDFPYYFHVGTHRLDK